MFSKKSNDNIVKNANQLEKAIQNGDDKITVIGGLADALKNISILSTSERESIIEKVGDGLGEGLKDGIKEISSGIRKAIKPEVLIAAVLTIGSVILAAIFNNYTIKATNKNKSITLEKK